ncbi:MAG: class I SAM-dependent methyltransferase, partial [Nanoarchaeota archaeon]|nr:class I SAM-dependent methyltransferase [Nanoarchaeota archaeon]
YNKINWENQEKTKLNSFIYKFVIKEIFSKKKGPNIKIFDIGFGVGFFIKMIHQELNRSYKNMILEGCEPSEKNYKHFIKKSLNFIEGVKLRTHNKTFLKTKTDEKFDFITSIYVFPHFVSEELEESAKKIHSMLNNGGKFILVVANEKYLKEKLKSMKDLFIEKNILEFDNKEYEEVLHYSDLPEIGKVIDYNREEKFYINLFRKHRFKLEMKRDMNDNDFICTIFVFEKL